jgi:LemA protein
MLIPILVVAGAIGLYILATYNTFIKLKTHIQASIQEIGNQLKRQADLIPNLQESAKAYLKHEKGIFKQLTDARKAVEKAVESGDLGDAQSASDLMSQVLPKIQVLVESNPEIKGSEVVNKLMNELRDTADKVMYARRTLIDITADYNIKVASFPSNIIAQVFKFGPEAGFAMPADSSEATSASAADLKTPKVDLG